MKKKILTKIGQLLSPYIYQHLNYELGSNLSIKIFDNDISNFIVFNQIEGDYLEFGAYKGDGLIAFHNALREQWRLYENHAKNFTHEYDKNFFEKKRFIAFDSFEGLPAEKSDNVPAHFSEAGTYSMPEQDFWNNIHHKLSDENNVVSVPGFFDKTLNTATKKKLRLKAAALVFIDCDLYSSSVPVFEFLTSLITDGTVIVIDDFFRYKGNPKSGIQRAFNEWKEGLSEYKLNELARVAGNRIAFVCCENK